MRRIKFRIAKQSSLVVRRGNRENGILGIKNEKERMRNEETLGCEMKLQIARRGQGPLSFWRTIGVVRPRN